MRKRYHLGDEGTDFNWDQFNWIRQTFNRDDYTLVDEGHFFASYYVTFINPEAETLFLLKWS